MPVAASKQTAFIEERPGVWTWKGWAPGVWSAVFDRNVEKLPLPRGASLVSVAQVHGAGIAWVEVAPKDSAPIAGCDALITHSRRLVLSIRTADCVPMLVIDPARKVIGVAHVGWRSLAADLPQRVVAAFRHQAQSYPAALRVALGPAIGSCCYSVGDDFPAWGEPFVSIRGGQRVCNLIARLRYQLSLAGVAPRQVIDSGRCTHCEGDHWFSLRREGPKTGRLRTCIMFG